MSSEPHILPEYGTKALGCQEPLTPPFLQGTKPKVAIRFGNFLYLAANMEGRKL